MKHIHTFFVLVLVLIIVASLALLVVAANAQETRGHGYMFAAPGALAASGQSLGTLHFGAGGEAFVHRGVAVGGELGYLGYTRSYSQGFGVLSGNAAYHFLPRRNDAKVVPFVTGGYSLGFRNGTMNMANFGGGVTWWVNQRHGVRLEFRDHYAPASDNHYMGFRVAWAFR